MYCAENRKIITRDSIKVNITESFVRNYELKKCTLTMKAIAEV